MKLCISLFSILILNCSLTGSVEKPNIVLFLVDDLGFHDISYHGNQYIQTVHIDSFAESCTTFTHAYAPAPGCSPSRASIMTGKYPARLKITGWIPNPEGPKKKMAFKKLQVGKQINHLPLEEYTLAEVLKDNGYNTCHIGKWHIGENEYGPSAQGFDSVLGYWPWAAPKSWFSPYQIDSITDGPEGEYITDRLTDEAIDFIRSNKDEPFFLNFWHYGVHTPLKAPEDLLEKYKNKGAPLKGKDNYAFQAMKESIDNSFGRVIQTLKEMNLMDNTIVIFSSDNGGVSYISNNTPLKGGKKMLYEGGIRVPTFVHWPKLSTPNQKINSPITLMDLYPTLLQTLHLELKQETVVDGINIAPLFKKDSPLRKELYFHWPHAYTQGPHSALLWKNYKIIEFQGLEKFELYDLQNDPSESKNLAQGNPELVQSLVFKLHKWLDSVDANYATDKEGKTFLLDPTNTQYYK